MKLFDLEKTGDTTDSPKPPNETAKLGSDVNNYVPNTKLAELIKDAVNKSTPPKRVNYFTPGKGKLKFDIIGSSLQPTKLTMIGGKFDVAYKKQIEGIMFNEVNQINPESLLPFLLLTTNINEKKTPIQISSGLSKTINGRICVVLNDFFNEHLSILKGMVEMFEGVSEFPEEEPRD